MKSNQSAKPSAIPTNKVWVVAIHDGYGTFYTANRDDVVYTSRKAAVEKLPSGSEIHCVLPLSAFFRMTHADYWRAYHSAHKRYMKLWNQKLKGTTS